jgi:ATP-binding cassette subfamily C protein
MTSFAKSLKTVRMLLAAYPRRTALVSLLLLLAGLSEGLGIGTLLPLLKIVMGGSGGDTYLGQYIDCVFTIIGATPSVLLLIGLLVALILLKSALDLLAAQQVGHTAARVESDLRIGLIRSLMSARWRYFIDQPAGRLANSMTNEAFLASHCYDLVCRFIAEGFQVLAYLGVACLVSWKMTLVGLVGAAISGAVLSRFIGMARRAAEKQTRLLSTVAGRLVDGLQGIKPLKAMACEERLGPLLESEIRALNEARSKQVLASAGMRSMHEPLLLLVLAAGGYFAFRLMQADLEALMVLMLLAWRSLVRVGNLQTYYQELARYESAFRSLRSAIEKAKAAEEKDSGSSIPLLSDTITFHNVTFSYGEEEILKNVSLRIAARSFTSIVGASGSGKTTIADLVVGLVRPDSGEVYIDRLPMSEVNLKAWRSKIGYVPQETLLFHDTVFTNVTLGDPNLSRDDVERSLRSAGAWEFVDALPEGMDTRVGERGGRLSGGQRQRIALARALARNPELLILDEVTSALDPASEAQIADRLKELRGKVTILAISHQQAFVDAADEIYVVDRGSIEAVAKRSEQIVATVSST